MNIIVCDDHCALEGVNNSEELCNLLRGRGHQVDLFDGRNPPGTGAKLPSARAGTQLAELMVQKEAECLVFDLHWFGSFTYGIEMLRKLKELQSLGPNMRVLVYSRYENEEIVDYHGILKDEFDIQNDAIFNRLSVRPEQLVQVI